MIVETKFENQNNMLRDKFLLDHLTFNDKTNGYVMKWSKQYNFLILKTKMKHFKKLKLK